MKNLVLVIILFFVTPKIFSQSINCAVCEKVITKGQPLYQVRECDWERENNQWGVIKFTRVNKFVKRYHEDFNFFISIEVEKNKELEYEGKDYVNLIDAYDYKWRDILKNKGNFLDYSEFIACTKEHAHYLISFKDKKAKISCNKNLEDFEAMNFSVEQIRTLNAKKNEELRKEREIEAKWDCINNYNKSKGYYKLLRGFDGRREFAFESTTEIINGREVKYIYWEDKTFEKRFRDDDSVVPGRNNSGFWGCRKGGGYIIQYLDNSYKIF